jgi:hypothetical protein
MENKPIDMVNHPPHYNQHPSGEECCDIAEPFGYYLGNAIKYIWRAGLKGDILEDLKKAEWYIKKEIERRSGKKSKIQKLQDFKDFVHNTLDKMDVPSDPSGPHSKEGCRIGDRLEYVHTFMAGVPKTPKVPRRRK